jgi:hypothetical protein
MREVWEVLGVADMSTITIYTPTIEIEADGLGGMQVTIEADAGDFVSEFMPHEILEAMDWSTVVKYVDDRRGEDDEDWT